MSEPEQVNPSADAVPNPYAAPKANVARPAEFEAAGLIEGGRKVSVGRGFTWLAQGLSLFMKSPGVWIGIAVIFVVGMFVLALIPVLGNLALNLLMPVFFAGLMLGCRALDHDEPLEVAHLFAGFRDQLGQLVLVGLLYMIGVVVIILGVAVVGGISFFAMFAGGMPGGADSLQAIGLISVFVLLAIALSLPLMMAFWFAPALVVFHQQEAMSAMKQSFLGCLKNFVPFLVYGLVAMVLMVLATLPVFLGWLVLWPVTVGSMYKSYQDIFAPGPDSE